MHVLQACQSSTTQSAAHACSLHARISVRYGHAYPPCCSCEITLRLRDCTPPAQDWLHVSHALKAATTQWCGHGPSLHACVSAECGHAAPPHSGATVMRERLCTPAPHVVVQVLHWLKSGTTQSTGQQCSLHARVSSACGHAAPPWLGCCRMRVRDCEPDPHDAEQVVQLPQVCASQSTAQGAALQLRVSSECAHAAPPKRGSVVTRVRVCEPPPHDRVHVLQACQSSTTQSAAHACSLHGRVSLKYGQT